MSKENVKIEDNVEIDLDEFLPGAEDIATPGDSKPSFFSKDSEFSLDDDDDDKDKDNEGDDDNKGDDDKKKGDDKEDLLKDFDPEPDEDDEEDKPKGGRKKIDKSGLQEMFAELIKEEVIIPFDDDKDLSEYSMKDWKELLQANIDEKEKAIKEQTPKEFFEALPQELQYAAKYVLEGGNDLKGLFKMLGKSEEIKSLDPTNESHQESIVRNYLYATNFGDEDLIEEQVEEWIESGVLEKKAGQFKPKLDKMQEQVIQKQLKDQENVKKMQETRKKQFMDNVYETLKPAELNGIKIDSKRQTALWNDLTEVGYKSMTGKPTNKLGKLLEEYQFGEKPRYDLIAEALWLLSDPDDYKSKVKESAIKENTEKTVRTLKTEAGRKIASSDKEDKDDGRKIKRKPVNIFKR